jgi:hypothetical protein
MRADEPVIERATLSSGHDGAAEAVITLRYPNGAVRDVTFGCDALADTLDAAGVSTLDELVGLPWTVLVAGLSMHETVEPAERPPT